MKKQDGFPGQLSYVIPEKILSLILQNLICDELYLTDIGYYPNASYHYRQRKDRINQTILIYNVEGDGIIKISDQEFKLSANHFFIIPEGISHSYAADLKKSVVKILDSLHRKKSQTNCQADIAASSCFAKRIFKDQ